MSETDFEALLLQIAEKLDGARHGYDYGEMSAESAFDSAIGSVKEAIRDGVREAQKRRRP